jgi:hypothetical protein
MRRSGLAVAALACAFAWGEVGWADTPPPLPPLPSTSAAPASASAPASPPASAPAPPPAPASAPVSAPARPAASPPAVAPNGVAVLAAAGATDAAWPLAQSVYATAEIRPYSVDEVHARVLCGEAPAAGAPADVRDLAETVAAIHGEDAASRAILGDIARRLNVRALVVVHLDAGKAAARLFVADGQSFDPATYAPDAGTPLAWTGTTRSLARTFGPSSSSAPAGPPAPVSAPPLATHEEPTVTNEPPKPKAFYETGWFWGALGAAAFAGGAVFFATRDSSASSIHLEMQVPH